MSHHPPSHPPKEFEGPVALFSSAWALFVKNWQFLVPLFIIPSLLIYIGNILRLTGDAKLGILSLLFVITGVILAVAQRASAIHAIHRYSTHPDEKLSLKEEYRVGFTFFWPIVWVTLLVGLLFFGSVIFLIVPAIVIGIYTMFYSFIMVLEGKRGLATFIESYTLVRGRWVDVLGRILFLALVTLGAYLVLAGAVFLLRSAFDLIPGSAGANALTMLFNLALSAIIGPVTVAYLYNLYESLKKTRVHHEVPVSLRRWLVALVIIGVIVTISIPVVALMILMYAPH